MTKGFSYILAASALITLSACTSGYVSGYDEIRQRTAAPESARAKPAQKQSGKKQAAQKQSARQKSASEKKSAAKKQKTQSSKARGNRTADPSASTTAALNQAQLNQNRKPAATQRTAPAPARPPQSKAQVQSVAGGTVTVGPGETLFAISRRTGVELRDIVLANNLEPPYTLRAGQKLTIPAARYHIVQAGETGYSVSRAYGTDLTTLARLNNLEKPYAVQVGQRLRLPASPTLPNGSKATTNVASAPAAATRPASQQAGQQAASPASTSTATVQKPLPAPAAFSGTFSWPLNGRILSRFGPKQGGLHNDGINIAATQGATVRAAAPGVIAYSGDGLKGFGWLILIKHSNGWVTAYAHNEAVLVKRGDTVRAGEPIARAGSTGSVDRPQLHFEIRNGRRAVDPLKHLPASPVS